MPNLTKQEMINHIATTFNECHFITFNNEKERRRLHRLCLLVCLKYLSDKDQTFISLNDCNGFIKGILQNEGYEIQTEDLFYKTEHIISP